MLDRSGKFPKYKVTVGHQYQGKSEVKTNGIVVEGNDATKGVLIALKKGDTVFISGALKGVEYTNKAGEQSFFMVPEAKAISRLSKVSEGKAQVEAAPQQESYADNDLPF